MSEREHTRALRDFRGEAKPEHVASHGPIAPWQATVTVSYLQLAGVGRRLQVIARWHGPPLPGSPPANRPVWTTDVYTLDAAEHEIARAIALRASEQLAEPAVPDLRGAAEHFRRRAEAAK